MALDEDTRLRLLADYGVMDTGPDDVLDKLVALASAICEVPISLVSLVDATRQWFKARVGTDATETPREHAFCAHAIRTDDVFTIRDARTDPRFTDNPLVTGSPNIVFYAGAPLIAEGGAKLGTLCVIDREPRELSAHQRSALAMLAELVVKRLRDRRDFIEETAACRRFEAALTSIGEAALTTNADGVVTFVNPVAVTLTGWPEAAALGRPVADVFRIVHDRTRAALASPIARVLRDGETVELAGHTLLVRRDGSELPIDSSAAPIRNARGTLTGGILLFRDQTAARSRDRELATFRTLVEQSQDVIAFGRPDGTLEYVNPAGQALLGPDSLAVLVTPDQLDSAAHSYVRAETALVNRVSSETLPVSQDVFVIRDGFGSMDRIVTVARDMRERFAAGAERERLTRHISHLFDTMTDGFLAIDAQWTLVTANQAFEHISTQRREDVLGRPFWDVFPRDERGAMWINYQRCMTERVPVAFQAYHAHLDRWTDQRANPTDDGGIAVFFHDITPAKRAEQLLEQQAAFERQLIGIVSHDLRTPLSVVTMAASLLAGQPELSPQSQNFVTRSHRAADRATAMIRDLLDFTQARIGGGLRIEREPDDLHEITRSVLDEVEATHATRTITCRAIGDGQGSWDRGRLGQVVQNLVANALKYSPPTSAVSVIVDGSAAASVTLTVHNEGEPMPANMIEILFEPFERGVGHTDSTTRSVGLGLYIVKKIIDAHRGEIEVVSTEAAGTTFRISLPRA